MGSRAGRRKGVSLDDALEGHVVDFIELQGAVSQPWEDGDLLMVRIR